MTAILSDVSEALADVVAAAGPSVVRVEGRQRVPASGAAWSADGLVVTAHHVLETDDAVTIGLANGERRQATLVGRDPTTDIALLRVQGGGIEAGRWADTPTIRVGHMVLALGRPGGALRATLGIVSALGDAWRTPAGGSVDQYLQSDVVMYPGFSGGPLVNVSGSLLGINTSMVLRGISLTLPTSTVRRVAQTLLEHGRVRRGFLGVSVQPVRLPKALAQTLSQETGLLVTGVEVGGPADQGGMILGDILVRMDEEHIRRVEDLLAFLGGERAGTRAAARIVRGGALQGVSVSVGER